MAPAKEPHGANAPQMGNPQGGGKEKKKRNGVRNRNPDDTLASGLYSTDCVYTGELMAVPAMVAKALEAAPELSPVVSNVIRAAASTHCLAAERLDRVMVARLLTHAEWNKAQELFESVSGEGGGPLTGANALLHFRLDVIQMLLLMIPELYFVDNGTHCLQQLLVMWMTAHVPLSLFLRAHPQADNIPSSRLPHMRLAIGPHVLPSRMQHIVADLDFFNNVTILKSQYETCLVHIMSKALPKRCQIRELARFMKKYMGIHRALGPLFSRMVLLTLLDLYPIRTEQRERMHGGSFAAMTTTKKKQTQTRVWHAPVQFELVATLYATFYLDTGAHTDNGANLGLLNMLDMSNNKAYTAQCQAFFFFIIREFVVYQVRRLPALKATLNVFCNWQSFEVSVTENLRNLRVFWATHSRNQEFNMETVMAMMKFAQSNMNRTRFSVEQVGQQSLVNTIDVILAAYYSHLETMPPCGKETMFRVHHAVVQSGWQQRCLFERILPPDDRTISQAVKGIVQGIFQECHGSTDANRIDTQLKRLYAECEQTYFRMLQVLMIAQADLNTSVHHLPRVLWAAQTMATNKVWERLGGVVANPQANTLLICQGCGEIKSTYSGVPMKTKRGVIACAPTHGSCDVTVDDNRQCLLCGKCSELTAHSRQSPADGDGWVQPETKQRSSSVCVRASSSNKIRYRALPLLNTAMLLRCANFPLMRVHLIGNIVVHQQTMYTICVACGCITQLTSAAALCSMMCGDCRAKEKQRRNIARVMQYDRHKGGIECELCSRTTIESPAALLSRYACFHSEDLYEPLVWWNLCWACTKVYNTMKRTQGVQIHTLEELRRYKCVLRTQQETRHIGLKRVRQ